MDNDRAVSKLNKECHVCGKVFDAYVDYKTRQSFGGDMNAPYNCLDCNREIHKGKHADVLRSFTRFESSVKDLHEKVNNFIKTIIGKKLTDVISQIEIIATHSPKLTIVIFDEFGDSEFCDSEFGDSDFSSSISYIEDYPNAVIIDGYISNCSSLVYQSNLSNIYRYKSK